MTQRIMLGEGLAQLGLDLMPSARDQLLAYVRLLKKWNATYNLTAIRDETDMLRQHVLDSLAIIPTLRQAGIALAGNWADVGSGAGLPGIPLAIAAPSSIFTLIDAVEKKSAFQRQAKIELGLGNVSVVCGRVEDISQSAFDAVVSRAFADLAEFVRLAGHLLRPGGRMCAMKGVKPVEEIDRLPAEWKVTECLKLSVPGLDAQRHLIVIERA